MTLIVTDTLANDNSAATAPQAMTEPRLDAFAQLQLVEPLASAVAEMGYESMMPIQAQAVPVVLQGRDVMGATQTGTGMTAAFSLPLLQRMLEHENSSTSAARHPVRALVLQQNAELKRSLLIWLSAQISTAS